MFVYGIVGAGFSKLTQFNLQSPFVGECHSYVFGELKVCVELIIGGLEDHLRAQKVCMSDLCLSYITKS